MQENGKKNGQNPEFSIENDQFLSQVKIKFKMTKFMQRMYIKCDEKCVSFANKSLTYERDSCT